MPQHDFEAFFAAYAKRSNDALKDPPVEDIDGTIESFAPYVVGSNPLGVMGGDTGPDFRRMIAEGFANYRKLGGTAMRVTGVKVIELDDFNVLARVDWLFDYKRPSDGREGSIAFQNIYFLNTAGDAPKIFAYITPDEQQAMKDHGLI